VVLPYAAYLRVYEPLSAFPAGEARRWSAYAASPDRPRRADLLTAEHAASLHRVATPAPAAAPAAESGDAYLRWSGGAVHVCPWQARLRSWLAVAQLRQTAPALAQFAFPGGGADTALRDFAAWRGQRSSLRVYIQTSSWFIPFAWFVPFGADERWLVLGTPRERHEGSRMTAAGTRTLVYATAMARARERAQRALKVLQKAHDSAPASVFGGQALLESLAELGSWLAEFHPESLLELDYGGLVHVLDDGALQADESVAEAAAAISGMTTGEPEFAAAMYRRFACRWHGLATLQRAS
jgi:hypothetical protein